MVSSINNIDRHRASAEAFVNMNDKNITQLATRANSIKHHKRNKQVGDVVNFATKSIPVVAAASAFAVTKSAKSAAKAGALWGALVGIPMLVTKANNKIKKDTATPDNKNGNGMSFAGELFATIAGYFGASAVINKLSKNPKVNAAADSVIAKSKDLFGKVADKVKVPESVSQKTGEVFQKAKDAIPNNVKTFVADNAAKVKNSNIFQKVVNTTKNFGKKALPYAPEIALGSVILGTLAYGVKVGNEIVNTKNVIKKDQLKTAQAVISSYKSENEDLKAQLAEKTAAQEA